MHVLTVFSPLPGTGKTTLACEFACRLARKGRQVFALDLASDGALTRRLLGARPHLAPLPGGGSPSPVPSAFTVFDAQRRDETLWIDTSRWPKAAHGVTVLRGDPRIRECSRWFDDAWSRDAALWAAGAGRLSCETWKREPDAIGHTLSMPLRVFHNTFEPRRADAIAVVDLGSESNGFNRAVLAGTNSVIVAVQCNRAAVEYLASAQASIDIMGRCASGPPSPQHRSGPVRPEKWANWFLSVTCFDGSASDSYDSSARMCASIIPGTRGMSRQSASRPGRLRGNHA